MTQHGPLVVECQGLLAGVVCGFILLQTLLESGLAFGTRQLLYGGVFFANGGIGFAFQLMEHLTEVTKLVEIIRHPQGHVARSPVTGNEAQPPIRGQAKAEEMVVLKRFKMRSPGVSRPIRRQLNIDDRRAACVNGHQNGCVDGENLIAEIKHQRL